MLMDDDQIRSSLELGREMLPIADQLKGLTAPPGDDPLPALQEAAISVGEIAFTMACALQSTGNAVAVRRQLEVLRRQAGELVRATEAALDEESS
jgi:hypothetical protein